MSSNSYGSDYAGNSTIILNQQDQQVSRSSFIYKQNLNKATNLALKKIGMNSNSTKVFY